MKRPRRSVFWLPHPLCLILIVSLTCGLPPALAAEEEATEESCASALPEWAPEEPSDEFLRAAKVLGFVPKEEVLPAGAGSPEMEAFLRAMTEILWPRSFELFGSLTDEQVEKFLGKQEIRLPIPSLPPSQKAALDNWLKAADEVIARAPAAVRPAERRVAKGGYLALLREEGAAKDLSNVDVGFGARGATVGVYFWIKRSPSGEGPIINNDFAKLKAKEAPPSSK